MPCTAATPSATLPVSRTAVALASSTPRRTASPTTSMPVWQPIISSPANATTAPPWPVFDMSQSRRTAVFVPGSDCTVQLSGCEELRRSSKWIKGTAKQLLRGCRLCVLASWSSSSPRHQAHSHHSCARDSPLSLFRLLNAEAPPRLSLQRADLSPRLVEQLVGWNASSLEPRKEALLLRVRCLERFDSTSLGEARGQGLSKGRGST